VIEAIIKIRCPKNWVSALEDELEHPIKFLDCMPSGKGGRGLVQIDADGEELNKMIEIIKAHPSICSVEIAPIKEGGVLGTIVTDQCIACKMLTDSNCFMTSAKSLGDGWVEWNLISGKDSALKDFVGSLKTSGCDVDIVKTQRLTKRQILTGRQEEIIQLALKAGYYDTPKKTTINKLAKKFDVASSTLAEILQRAEKKIIGRYFQDDV